MVRLDGMKSHVRKEMLKKACDETGTKYRKPIHHGATRFGSQEKTAQRCVDLKLPIFAMPDIDPYRALPDDNSDEDVAEVNSRSSWADIKRELSSAYPILDHILPIFREVEQWTQIVSSNRNPTLSKCSLACRRFSQLIKELETRVFSMQDGKLKTDLENAVKGLELARQTHMGRDYYNFPLIRVAEFLDVEVFHTIPLDEWQELRGDGTIGNPGLISNFLLEADTISPWELARRLAAEGGRKSC